MYSDTNERLDLMESKLGRMLNILEDQRKKPNSNSLETLHLKIDKVIRLLSDVAENQKKNSKSLYQLQKAKEAQALKEQEEMEKVCLLYVYLGASYYRSDICIASFTSFDIC